jgi:hypothetical protein
MVLSIGNGILVVSYRSNTFESGRIQALGIVKYLVLFVVISCMMVQLSGMTMKISMKVVDNMVIAPDRTTFGITYVANRRPFAIHFMIHYWVLYY